MFFKINTKKSKLLIKKYIFTPIKKICKVSNLKHLTPLSPKKKKRRGGGGRHQFP